jgi:hypothetical protein
LCEFALDYALIRCICVSLRLFTGNSNCCQGLQSFFELFSEGGGGGGGNRDKITKDVEREKVKREKYLRERMADRGYERSKSILK